MKSIAVTASIWLLLAAATLGQGHVHTSRRGARVLPLPREKGVWHFVVYGDRTGGPAEGVEVLRQAVTDTNLLDPDLVMTVGDLVQGYNETPQWKEQAAEFSGIMNGLRMPWYPVAGNHDVYWRRRAGEEERPAGEHESNYEAHFGPLWYWFPHKTAAFVVLYTDEGNPETDRRDFRSEAGTRMSQKQIGWLKETLKKTRKYREVFVFLHHPRWLKHRYAHSNWDEVHAVLAAARNVKSVFAGHIHQMDYAGVRDGIEYFALATTGGGLPRELPHAGWLHHLNVVTVRDGSLSVASVPVGSVIDPREVTTERVEDVKALVSRMRPEWSGPLSVLADGSARGSVEVVLENPARRAVDLHLEPRSTDGAWTFEPDHLHHQLAAGESVKVSLRYRRAATGFRKRLGIPQLAVRADYLAETVRITLPERSWRVALALAATPAASGVVNGRLELDGKRGCVEVPSADLPLPDGPFTLEGWVQARQLKGRRPFLAKTEQAEFSLFMNDGRPEFAVHVAGAYCRARARKPILEAGRWHHLAGVWDGNEARLYVDGRLCGRAKGEGERTRNDLPLYIGADPNASGSPVDHLDGAVDEVRLSRTARYLGESFEPARRHETDSSTVLLLHLDRFVGPFAPNAARKSTGALRRGGARIVSGGS